ncbi:MAG: CxxxxCH/CxxCH domain-containing protein [Ignavibacteriaceae bacterium]|nr:CxxxxCH/CxxCH domain-containing protein [Ignavibacteriaceae bacterium]
MINSETRMIKILFKYFSFIFILILIAACSELNTDIPSVPKLNTHGDSLYNPTSPNYHPKTIAGSPNGMYDCQECHAADFSGGVAKVGCNTSNCHPSINVHVAGIVDPSSINFHGNYIKNNQWDMISCQSCHGAKYGGGEFKYSDGSSLSPTCLDCHTYVSGPENCTTCHGSPTSNAPPTDINGNTSTSERGVGAHQIHLKGGDIGRNLTCTECHNVPGGVYTPGHVDSELPAEIFMNNPRANISTNDDASPGVPIDPQQIHYIPTPAYNSADLTCSNTYCHGYFKNGNIDNKPVWNDPSTSQCGSCHGGGLGNPLPKTQSDGGNHPNSTNCSNCHGGVVDQNRNIINPSKHIDGLLNLFGNDIKF